MYLYGQYCPVARASEILADRWTPLIVRELLAGLRHFNDLDRGLPGISRALLDERLRRLERMGIVERHVSGEGRAVEYALTRAGRELQRVIDVLGGWGARWAFGDPRPSELDPIVLERTDVSVCLQHPKFDIDLRVSADIAAFYRVWLGRTTLREAMQAGVVRLDGMPAAVRAFPRWFAWSPTADAVRGALQRREARLV